MKKRWTVAVAAMMAVSAFAIPVGAQEESEFLTMIPNHDNAVGTLRKDRMGKQLYPQSMWNSQKNSIKKLLRWI